MIDYADDINPMTQGPFFDPAYGGQTNDNPTYIDRSIIRQLIWEISDYLSNGQRAIDIDVDLQYDFGIGIDDPSETIYITPSSFAIPTTWISPLPAGRSR